MLHAIYESLSQLQAQYPQSVEVMEYGRSVQDRPLLALVIKHKSAKLGASDHPTIVGVEALHGDERMGIISNLPPLLIQASLKKDSAIYRFLIRGGAFVFIPLANPDGFVKGERDNAHQHDLNRHWNEYSLASSKKKNEERFDLAKLFEKLRVKKRLTYKILIDYHCCSNALVTAVDTKILFRSQADQALQAHIEKSAKQSLNVRVGSSIDVLGYQAQGTLKDYFAHTYHAHAFTFEGPSLLQSPDLGGHLRWWTSMAQALSHKDFTSPKL